MKKFGFTFLIVASALYIGCSYDDDGSYINLEIRDAIVFENSQNYVVGDTIFFELSFSRYLDEEGYPNKLDVFESSGAESFYYNFGLNKYSEQAGSFGAIAISEEFVFSEKGTLSGFGGATADLNETKTTYESRVGIIIVETGIFQLDFDFYSLTGRAYEEDKVYIDIQHKFTGDQPDFEFTVADE